MLKWSHIKIFPIFLLLVILIIGLFTPSAAATPPEALALSFNKDTHTLNVTVTHETTDPTSHYIKKIDLEKNGKLQHSYPYSSQPDKHRFTYVYDTEAKKGDLIKVTAFCSLFGQRTSILNITTGEVSTTGGASYSLWPYHAALMVVGAILCTVAIAAVYMKKKPWWLKGHRIMGMIGGTLMFIGVGVAAYMITSAGGTHLRVPHAWVGLLTIIILMIILTLAMVYTYFNKMKRKVRKPHLWLGRVAIPLMGINIILGIVLVGLITFG